jgi:uncharacterized membrane protein
MMLAGVLIRQFFVLRHRGEVKWWLPAAGVALIAHPDGADGAQARGCRRRQGELCRGRQVLAQRCTACHADKPTQAGFAQRPRA